uniref:Protein vestigial n=1 Tax=Glossina palpalis gambiensis TaxID=67801 RepID=A0A1B0C6I3_9MUSC
MIESVYTHTCFNQDLYSSSGVQLASSSASGSSHSPCSPILPPSVSANAAAAAVAAAHNTAAAVVAAAAQTANQASSSLSANLPLSTGSSSSGGGGIGANIGSGSGVVASSTGGLIGSNIGNTLHSRTHTKEEDLGAVPRNDAEARLVGVHHHNESSCSSGPDSPRHHNTLHGAAGGGGGSGGGGGAHSKDMPLDSTGLASGQGRAQYLSATCVVFTNYSGDTASVVDEHFSRALNFNNKDSKEASSPMSARNFPPSFWNSNYVHPVTAPTHPQMSDLYSSDGGYATDPWVPHAAAAHYGTYAHAAHAHAAHAHAYHHNMAQYGSLLRLPQQYGHSSRLHHDQQTAHALESAAAYSSYPTMAGKLFISFLSSLYSPTCLGVRLANDNEWSSLGLEAQVQESSKDLYWF